MMKFRFLAFGVGLGLTAAIAQETAQPVPVPAEACVPSDKLLALHKDKWDESPILGGDTTLGSGIIVFTSPKGETWTIVHSRTDGQSCIIAAGTGLVHVAVSQEI